MDEKRKTKCGVNDDDTTGCPMQRVLRVVDVTEHNTSPLMTRKLIFEIVDERP